MNKRLSGVVAVSICLRAGVAMAQAITDPTTSPAEKPAAHAASPSPFSETVAFTVDGLDSAVGGRRPGVGFVDLIKLSVSYDGGTVGHDGLSGLISIEHANGAGFTTEKVGALQAVSANESTPAALRLYEAWLRRDILQGRGAVKAGLIDINTTFDVQETAAVFLNGSHGLGPDIGDTGRNGASDYPTPALAVTAVYRPAEGWTAQLGIFDAVSGDPNHRGRLLAITLSARDGALLIGQIERRVGDRARVELGAWAYTAAFPSRDAFDADGTPKKIGGNTGVYALAEGRLSPSSHEGGGLSGWLRAGVANGHINPVKNYLGAGLVYTGPFKGRDSDEIGVAIARAASGRPLLVGHGGEELQPRAGVETDFELTYRYAFKSWLTIQPDLQYVVHPAVDAKARNALVVGVRLAFTATR